MSANNCKVREIGQNRKTRQKKKNNNKNRLLLIFAGTFVVFFLIFSVIASTMTPKIDITNDTQIEEDSLSGMTSDDFKGRIDPSLKEIEARESRPLEVTKQPDSKKTAEEPSQTESLTQDQQMDVDTTITESMMPVVSEDIPVKKAEIKRVSEPVKPKVQPAPPKPAPPPLILRDKIRQSSSSSNYSSSGRNYNSESSSTQQY